MQRRTTVKTFIHATYTNTIHVYINSNERTHACLETLWWHRGSWIHTYTHTRQRWKVTGRHARVCSTEIGDVDNDIIIIIIALIIIIIIIIRAKAWKQRSEVVFALSSSSTFVVACLIIWSHCQVDIYIHWAKEDRWNEDNCWNWRYLTPVLDLLR